MTDTNLSPVSEVGGARDCPGCAALSTNRAASHVRERCIERQLSNYPLTPPAATPAGNQTLPAVTSIYLLLGFEQILMEKTKFEVTEGGIRTASLYNQTPPAVTPAGNQTLPAITRICSN